MRPARGRHRVEVQLIAASDRCGGTRRGSERYGDLGGSCVPVRFDGSGADDRFRSKNCGIDFERAPCALRERIWGGAAGRCGATMQAGALPGESEPEWRWSMRWRIDGAGIMRSLAQGCRHWHPPGMAAIGG